MATTARNRRLEPAYKQHTAADDGLGVIPDVAVTTGEAHAGDPILPPVDAVAAVTGQEIKVVTADQGLRLRQGLWRAGAARRGAASTR